jgi:hypothetical protein
MNYFAAWSLLGIVAAFIGLETRGRTIDEIDSALTGGGPVAAPARTPAA